MALESHNELKTGNSPLLISIPHAGTVLPDRIRERLLPAALPLPDTDWFVDQLYGWAPAAGAGVLTSVQSRFVIDLNRPPDDAPLYSSETTGLIPLTTFAGESVYHEEDVPDRAECRLRVRRYWQPYHDSLEAELNRLRERYGYAVLLDAHSIAGEVPRLFPGQLPDLNLGSNGGVSASADLIQKAWAVLENSDYSSVLDGRFRGGYITRHYGNPSSKLHALQLEISQRNYMQESPPVYKEQLAQGLQSVLKELVDTLIHWTPDEN